MSVFDLWIPIVAAGLATHILSTLAWTVSPHHKQEYQKLPNEDEIQDALAAKNVTEGQFMFPFAQDGKEMNSDEYKAKQGKCTGLLILWGKPVNMGIAIVQTLTFFMIVAFVIAYLASLALPKGDTFMHVFQFVTTAGLLAHCAGLFPGNFWFKHKVALDLLDKAIYAVVTGLIFASLWPAA